MESQVKDKVVDITGASSGIGKAIAIELAKKGAKVVLGARRLERLKDIAGQINKHGGQAVYSVVNVKSRTDLIHLVNLAVEEYGRLDVMVNNAGTSEISRIDELDTKGWDEMIDINIKGVLHGMAAAIPIFKRQQSGHIVNIISTSGIKIVPTQSVYAGTKNAVRTITEAFRQESDGSIRITGISPGFVKTSLIEKLKNEEIKTAARAKMEEIGIAPEAIANAVIYAISQPKEVEVGFGHPQSFNKLFKTKTKVSPLKFRQSFN